MSYRPAPLPKSWPHSVKSAVIQAISLAEFVMTYTRGWGANCPNARIRMKAELDQANQENALLREQLRIHNVRMELIPSQRRPNYPPPERMAILELKAARGWSLEQTAKAFLVTSATISSWMRRLDEEGSDALVQLRQPVNKFPDFARYIVQRLKTLCPMLGKVKIAQTLARAGLHLGPTTVGRILKEKTPRPVCKQSRTSQRRSHRHGQIPWASLACYVVDHITCLLWRSPLCGPTCSSDGISAFRPFCAPHNFGVMLWGDGSVSPFFRRFDHV